MTTHTNCKPGCRYVGMAKHPAECEPRETVDPTPAESSSTAQAWAHHIALRDGNYTTIRSGPGPSVVMPQPESAPYDATAAREACAAMGLKNPPPQSCWLCSKPLGSHPDCLMCDAYRKDTAPKPSAALQSPEPLTEDT